MPSTLSIRYWQCSCLLCSPLSCSIKKYPDRHCTSVILLWVNHTLGRRQGNCHFHLGKLSACQLAQLRKSSSIYPLTPFSLGLLKVFLIWEGSKCPQTNMGCTGWLKLWRESLAFSWLQGEQAAKKASEKAKQFLFCSLKDQLLWVRT